MIHHPNPLKYKSSKQFFIGISCSGKYTSQISNAFKDHLCRPTVSDFSLRKYLGPSDKTVPSG